MNQALATLTTYPTFLSYEERLTKSPYNVMEWYNYLSDIDEALEAIHDKIKSESKKAVAVAGRSLTDAEVLSELQSLRKCRILVAERALALLPGSYKLWMMHLTFLRDTVLPVSNQQCNRQPYKIRCSNRNKRYRQAISAFERALVRMNKFPRIWLTYLDFVVESSVECNLSTVRRIWDRCLCALPATQHELIWSGYVKWVVSCVLIDGGDVNLNEMALRVLRRRCQFDPSTREELADMCSPIKTSLSQTNEEKDAINSDEKKIALDQQMKLSAVDLNRPGEAAKIYQDLLNEAEYMSPRGTTRHEMWQRLCELCSAYPTATKDAGVDFERIIRDALNKSDESSNFFNEVRGTLYLHLARYHTHAGLFNKVRSVYAEAISSVNTVRDFSLVFDASVRFEEGLCSALMEQMEPEELESTGAEAESKSGESNDVSGLSDLLPTTEEDSRNKTAELNWTLSRMELLLEKRPLMLNRVLLRQNPHNVGEWLKRGEMLQDTNKSNAIHALEEACKTVKSNLAVNGNPAQIWIQLARYYNDNEQIENAKETYQRGLKYKFNHLDNLATVHASNIDYLLELEEWDEALSAARRGVGSKTKLSHSVRAWITLLDLEEALGTIQTTKASYNQCLDAGMATLQICVNFTDFLWDRKCFEETFTVFERALDLFPQPEKRKHIWDVYLSKFNERYIAPFEASNETVESAKLERLRELYERSVTILPAKLSGEFFLRYAKLEEKHGLMQRALNVYERLCIAAPTSKEKFQAYQLYIIVASRGLGKVKTRPIYEAAIAALEDKEAAQICIQYAGLETDLGELQRARALWVYGAQMADPRRDVDYWKSWHSFEVENGNEETFREMLRVKRGVAAAFSTVNYNAAEMGAGVDEPKTLTDEEAFNMITQREGIKAANTSVGGFVSGTKRKAQEANLDTLERQAAKLREATSGTVGRGAVTADEGEIDLDEDEENSETEVEPTVGSNVENITTREVPAAVFGGLKEDASTGTGYNASENKMGALERLRAAAAANK
uniref:Pre-mRNA-splicing factor SYF1 n=1 Tax=Leptocylindrus danicus TaxID=163516 RepID=A0A7S2LGF2_9STRA|mmetsp:Transcript_5353/g.7851  ORF Transcript_5353/g.7851 Transcript_5353/m.7851 type:complete len:1017 (+) Transcript_5353:66-3116(+)